MWPAIVVILGVAVGLTEIVTVRWLYQEVDGMKFYGYGFPLPWLRFSGVSSMQYEFQVPLMSLNVLCVAVLLLPLLGLLRKLLGGRERWVLALTVGLLVVRAAFGYVIEDGPRYFAEPLFGEGWTLLHVEPWLGWDRPYWP